MHLGKAGNCAIAQGEALLRSISMGLRWGTPSEEFVKQLQGIRCPSVAWDEGKSILSCADAIASVLTEFKDKGVLLKDIDINGSSKTVSPVNVPVAEEVAEATRQIEELRRRRQEDGID
jgi:ribonucleoside-diphosphate reductase alpha chain